MIIYLPLVCKIVCEMYNQAEVEENAKKMEKEI